MGPALAARLERLGLRSVQDVLFHLPLRYQDRTRVRPIGSLQPGEDAVIVAEVLAAQRNSGRRRSLLVAMGDGTGILHLRFFHFSAAQESAFQRGIRLHCFGEVRAGPAGLEMVHPEYRRAEAADAAGGDPHLTPVYPTTAGLHQASLRRLTDQALRLGDEAGVRELLPAEVLTRLGLPDLQEALRLVHRPPPGAAVQEIARGDHPAQRRLAFEELLAHRLSLLALRRRAREVAAPALAGTGALAARLRTALPFRLTRAQERVVAEVRADLLAPVPMLRLVQGDVGSGKTVVAALAALQAVEAGCQVAVMAPTELLAEQHLGNFRAWLEPLAVPVAWISGRSPAGTRRAGREAVANGEARVAVGTHALFQEQVRFQNLALVIVDEQHRFGVHQRLALREKGTLDGRRQPHQLIMTATPIPRTLAMTAYADLDLSVLDELPPGRTPVETVAMPESRRAEVVARIHGACQEGRQAYWVCPLIEESELLEARAAADTAARLAAALPALRVGLVHGRLKPADKDRVMTRFKAGELDLLVATTVIEVGVDVPRASLMVIENSERLGLAQLHQLRGRVGRGATRSSCVLLYRPPLSLLARERLRVMRESNDGFRIAERDLELRGPGEVLGTRQTGMLQFRVSDLVRDRDLLPTVGETAALLLASYPDRCEALVRRWIGDGVHYGHV